MIKRFLTSVISLLTFSVALSSCAASAMGSGNKYVDAQTGLTYSLYKPVNTLGLAQSKFQLLVCGGGGEEWVYVNFVKGTKKIETMQTMSGAHCSNPGLSVKMPSIKVNGLTASVFVYCDPTKPNAAKNCKTADMAKVGGYLMMTLPGYYKMKPTTMQVQVSGGLSYADLLSVARSMTPASTKASN